MNRRMAHTSRRIASAASNDAFAGGIICKNGERYGRPISAI
jgi:hypothetical protein